jgi:hypothetical protein
LRNRRLDVEENLELEKMVDKTSLWKVLSDLVDICYAKDDHLRSAWQDNIMANRSGEMQATNDL